MGDRGEEHRGPALTLWGPTNTPRAGKWLQRWERVSGPQAMLVTRVHSPASTRILLAARWRNLLHAELERHAMPRAAASLPDRHLVQERIRRDISEWMRYLRQSIGFDGWRFDYVKGWVPCMLDLEKDGTPAVQPACSVGCNSQLDMACGQIARCSHERRWVRQHADTTLSFFRSGSTRTHYPSAGPCVWPVQLRGALGARVRGRHSAGDGVWRVLGHVQLLG